MRKAASIPTMETVEPIDRSMLPMTMTNVSPSASTVRTAACCRMFVAFRSEKKLPFRSEKTMVRMMSASTGPSVGIERRRLAHGEPSLVRFAKAAFDAA